MTPAKRHTTPDPEILFREAEQYEEMGDLRSAFKRLLLPRN
jgi:hypothetical protein